MGLWIFLSHIMITHHWQQVYMEWYFEDLVACLFLIDCFELRSWEDFVILIHQVEQWAIVWSEILTVISMIRYPLIIVKRIPKDLALICQKRCNYHTFLNQLLKVSSKQERRHKAILILNDVLDDVINGFELVVLKSIVDCWSVEALVGIVLLCGFVSVDYWVFFIKELRIIIIKQVLNWSAVKRKHRQKVCAI